MPRVLALLPLLLVAACGGNDAPTVIDGSSQESYERTLSEAKGELGPQDRLKFEAALAEFRAQMFAKADDRQEYKRMVREGMDGLTAPRIVTEFNRNVDKIGKGAADALFDAKRAVVGRNDGGVE
jgi:hypothetical protein